MLKTYQTCPRKFYFQYAERVNIPRLSTPFEKGKKIHALANYYLQGIDISKLEKALNPDEYRVWKALSQNPYFQKKCYKSEFQLSCKIDNFWIGGRLDAVMSDEDKYYILDYKTGSIPENPKFDCQTMIYLLALDKHLSNKAIEFVYIDLKNGKNHIISFDETVKTDYIKRILSICSAISSDNIYKPNCQNCSKCEYNKLCTKSL
jgi:CRISPR/Cas system-associated exonuclease Cas4 (RecB family)